jgi:hypothetical protein
MEQITRMEESLHVILGERVACQDSVVNHAHILHDNFQASKMGNFRNR